MLIANFRTNPLSDKIVNALIDATQAYSSMNVLVNEYSQNKRILHDMLLSLDIYYDLFNTQPKPIDTFVGLYIPNQENVSVKKAEAIRICTKYAQDKVQLTDVLTAGDILKIDRVIKNVNIEQLLTNEIGNQDSRDEAIWSILHDLYGPQLQYPLLLETVIACYRLLTFSDTYRLELQSLSILFSSFYQNPITFRGLPRQWILSVDPLSNIELLDTEKALILILRVFQKMWFYTATFIRKLNDKKDEISKLINSAYPQCALVGFHKLLSENIYIRNNDVIEVLHISKKTAIKYLKQLEDDNIIFSIKSGREIFYFNNMLLDILKWEAEVS